MKKKLLIIIPARSGSKRVKNKNMKKIKNETLLGKKIKSCLQVKNADVFVSTESKRIANYAIKCGAKVPFLRDIKYASDRASTISVILDVIRNLKNNNYSLPEYIGILPATNPFLKTKNIKEAYKKLISNKIYNSILSYTESSDHPFNYIKLEKKRIKFNLIRYENKRYSDFERTQDWPKSFVSSAALKITKISFFLKMLKNRSQYNQNKTFDINSCIGLKISKLESFDINSSNDFKLASKLL